MSFRRANPASRRFSRQAEAEDEVKDVRPATRAAVKPPPRSERQRSGGRDRARDGQYPAGPRGGRSDRQRLDAASRIGEPAVARCAPPLRRDHGLPLDRPDRMRGRGRGPAGSETPGVRRALATLARSPEIIARLEAGAAPHGRKGRRRDAIVAQGGFGSAETGRSVGPAPLHLRSLDDVARRHPSPLWAECGREPL